MAYNREQIEREIIEVIKKEKITFFGDLVVYIAPAMSTLYEWQLEKSEDIKRELAINRINTKKKLRNNWEQSDNATLQLALYKLIGDDDELERLNTNYNKNKTEHSGEMNMVFNEQKTYEAVNKTD